MSKLNLDSILEPTSKTEILSESSLITNNISAENSNKIDAELLDKVLYEWSYKCRKGYPVFGDSQDMQVLQTVLSEMKIEHSLNFQNYSSVNEDSATNKKAPSTIEGAATPEMKEGLVVYFATHDSALMEKALAKVTNQTNTSILKLPTNIDAKYYGQKSATLVKNAIVFLNENAITPNNSRLYLNAISIAKLIQEKVGKLAPGRIDRGEIYSKVREHAVKLIQTKYELPADPDKWCPADIYIYGDAAAGLRALQTDELNVNDKSLNAMFNNEFKVTPGIIGISLKEAKAQAGKATSFRQTLTRKENYPEATPLDAANKASMELLYNLNQLRETSKNTPRLKIGYVAEAAQIIKNKKIKNTDAILTALDNTLKLTFKDFYKSSFGSKGGYNKEAARKAFDVNKLTNIVKDKNLDKLISVYDTTIRTEAIKEYKKSRTKFLDTLKKLNFEVPSDSGKPGDMDSETLFKKSSCYLVGEYLLSGLNSEGLQIPSGYTTLIQQKNAFVALTAYAIGMSGISPTFFKVVGSDTVANNAHLETFYGDGFLNLDNKGKTKISDSPLNKGFGVTFIVNVTLTETKNAKIQSSYKVDLDFRYAGDSLNIEVSKLTAVK